MKYVLPLIFCLVIYKNKLNGQTTIREVLQLAEINAPESKVHLIADEKAVLEKSNIDKNLLPQFKISGQYSYQSDVTFLDVNIPGIEIERPSEIQYKLQTEVGQLIYDGGTTEINKKKVEIESQISKWQAELQIEKLRAQAIQIYFALLEVQEHTEIIKSNKEDLQTQIIRMENAYENEIILASDLSELQVGMIQLDQNQIDLETQKNILLNLLSLLTGSTYKNEENFERPLDINLKVKEEFERAYVHIINWQKSGIETKLAFKDASLKPKLSGFGQFGIGRPGLNFLQNELSEYYIVGLRINVDFGNLYSQNNDKQIAILEKERLEIDKQVFIRNLKILTDEYQNNIDRFERKIENEKKLLELKENIYNVAKAQFENGIMNSSDYLEKLNDVFRARRGISIATLEKLKYQYLLDDIQGTN